MSHFLTVRLPAFIVWILSVGLTFYLLEEFTRGQSPVIGGLAAISLLVSAIGLLMATYANKRADRLQVAASLTMYTLGAAVMIFLELGFWNSAITTTHLRLQRADAALEGAEMLAARQRQAVRGDALAETSAEIQAKMDAQLSQPVGNQPLGKVTSNCADTQSAAYRLCGDYLGLKAQKAKAEARERAEKQIWERATNVEVGGLKQDIFSGATVIAEIAGGKPESWAIGLSVLMLLLLMATRDLSAICAFGPSKGAPKAAKAAPEPVAAKPAKSTLVVQLAPEPKARLGNAVEDLRTRLAGDPEVTEPDTDDAPWDEEKPQDGPVIPPPHPGGGTPLQAPAADADDDRVIYKDFGGRAIETKAAFVPLFAEDEPPVKRAVRGKVRADRKPLGAARRWLEECCSRSIARGVAVGRQEAYTHYLDWCDINELRSVKQKQFHDTVNRRIGSAGGEYVGLVLCNLMADEDEVRAYG